MKTTIRTLFTTALIALAACASSGTKTTTSQSAAMNTKCPVSNEALGKEAVTTTFQGQTVGFCCNNCLTKFNGMTDADKKAKVTAATPSK